MDNARGNRDLPEGAAAFPDEAAYLEEVKAALAEAVRDADAAVERYDRDYVEQQRYIVNYRHEIDPKEIFQSTLALRDIDRAGAHAARFHDKLRKLADSPYFARIDFASDARGIPATAYIGRFAFTEDDGHVIHDWRAPISGMFYDHELGPAFYDAPAGRITGELVRKRQFRIAGGEMEYCLESSLNIQDDVLQRELSRTADNRMKTIIATIQREQNRIIRDEQAEVLIIQGVAGSGKTSIALHRVAYLLYRHKERLTAKNVAVISPNRVFGDYISGVLPELGEEPVYQVGFADIAHIQLEGVIGFRPAPDPFAEEAPAWGARARYKSTTQFLRTLDSYLDEVRETCFRAADYSAGGHTVPAAFIAERYRAYPRHPIRRRLREVAGDVLDRLHGQSRYGEKLPSQRAVLSRLSAMCAAKSTLALYKAFYRWAGARDMLAMPDKRTLEWADVYPFLYVHAAFEGLTESPGIRHLVIDEMQDYSPVQFAVADLLFPCGKTILGDCMQGVNPYAQTGPEDFRELYPGARFVELHTSYRSSWEIIQFARGIVDGARIEPVERHGDPVEVVRCGDGAGELEEIRERVAAFRRGGLATMGIVTKTRAQAAALHAALDMEDVRLLDEDSRTFAGGVQVVPVQMAKGLEFDEVLVPGVDAARYRGGLDRRLLYVACTRAMHRLSLTGVGPLPEFVRVD